MWFLLLVLGGVCAQQYTLTLWFNADCTGANSVFLAESQCLGFTDPSFLQLSWQTQTAVEPGGVPIDICSGTLNCLQNCELFIPSLGVCFPITNVNSLSGTIVRGAPPSTTSEGASTTPVTGVTSTTTTTTGTTTTKAPGGGGGGGMCFHEHTQFYYNGLRATYSMSDPGPCRVPHVLRNVADGVIVRAGNRALRVTREHLVYTQRGLVAAGALVPGQDVLYLDMEERAPIKVLSVVRETEPQTYYGLNCPHGSAVLADGFKASTFDTYHTLPAIWMSVMSTVVGIDRASEWGDALAQVGKKVGIV